MFVVFFSIALLIANVYCFIKKKYLYLFIPCMLFLPEYYGIDITNSLPVLTVTRLMFLVFFVYAFINRRKSVNIHTIKNINIKKLPKKYLFLFAYFILRLIPNIFYITSVGQAAKTIFLMIFEQAMLIMAIYLLDPRKDEIFTLIKTIVFTATAFFIIGIYESFTFMRPFDNLYTVSRTMLNEHFIRLGLLRSTTTLGLPIFFGNMCLITFPLILYLYDKTKEKKYLIILFFNFLAMIHSGCRADLFFYGFILVLYFIFVTKGAPRKLLCIRNFFIVATMVIIFAGSLSINSQYYRYFYTGTVKSTLNEFGFDFDLKSGAPEGVEGFGSNGNYGSESRLAQFSGMVYTMRTSPFIGLGSKAQTRGDVQFYSLNRWHPSYTYDVGYVEMFCDEGIIGFMGYLSLFIALLLMILEQSHGKLYLNHTHYKLFLVVTYLLGMLCTANMFPMLFTILIFCNWDKTANL